MHVHTCYASPKTCMHSHTHSYLTVPEYDHTQSLPNSNRRTIIDIRSHAITQNQCYIIEIYIIHILIINSLCCISLKKMKIFIILICSRGSLSVKRNIYNEDHKKLDVKILNSYYLCNDHFFRNRVQIPLYLKIKILYDINLTLLCTY